MRTGTRAFSFLAGMALALACTFPASAQMGSRGMGGISGTGSGRGMRNAQQGDATTSTRGVSAADALYDARTRLLITQEQGAAWERFYQAYLRWTALVAVRRGAADAPGAMQAVQDQLASAQAHLAATQELSEAVNALLPTLSDNQRQIADSLIPQLLALTSTSGQRIVPR